MTPLWSQNDEHPNDLAELFAQLDDEDSNARIVAADALAHIVDRKIAEPIRKRISVEDDFHVKLALHYALAAQGEKSSLQFLIDALEHSGHLGAVYLDRVTGQGLNWDIASYRQWYKEISDEQFRTFINDRWKRKPMRDEWAVFVSLFEKKHLSSERDTTGELIRPEDHLTPDEVKRIEELPIAKAWNYYESAISKLQKDGNRSEAARLFRKVATDFPSTYYADDSKELADLLDEMLLEDKKFLPPKDFNTLGLEERVKFHIYKLRDVVAYQTVQPGSCDIFSHIRLTDALDALDDDASAPNACNAAVALRDIGEPAIPFLIELSDDRRPIRAVGYWRRSYPTRTILRYNDAAIQIIAAIRRPVPK